jgi:DNA-binding SARP family transcriptional activator
MSDDEDRGDDEPVAPVPGQPAQPRAQASGPGRLRLRLLGPPAWRLDDGDWQPLQPLDAVLVAVLAIDGPCARDTLAGRLWPGGSRLGAPNNLRQRVSRLLRQVGVPLFITGSVYRLAPGLLTDVGAEAEPAGDLAAGDDDFLAGCEFGHSEWLQDWVAAQRQALRTARGLRLSQQADACERAGDLPGALALAWRVTALTPLHEAAWRQLMRLQYLQGDHTSAVEAFERFEALLREQTGARPGPETLHLLSTIENVGHHPLPRRRLPASLQRPPRRIGRDTHWVAMNEAWDAGRAFLLWGEAGMGKSRLLEDFLAGRAGVVSERARPGDALAAYTLLARLLRGVMRVTGIEPQGLARRELSRLLPELGPAAATPGDEARLRSAVEALLLQAQAAPAALQALVLDDLQFADIATLEALRWLGASTSLAGLRLGLAARPPDDGALRSLFDSWLGDSQRPLPMDLRPLTPPEVDDLLASLQLPGFTDAALGSRLVAHTGGHPLFLLETLKEAWLHERDPAAGDALPRPASVQALIEGRLRDLPADATDLLRVAAIAGEDFDAARASALLGRGPLALVAAWSALERAQVLNGSRFAHDLMQECAAALVPPALAQVLHAMLAELLQADARVPAARIAARWQAAGRPADAALWWRRAADTARLAGRLQEQQSLLERAAAGCREAGEHAAEFDCVHDSLYSGMLRHGGQSLLAALPRLQALARSPRQQLDVLLLQAEAVQTLDRFAEALDLAVQAERLAQTLGARLGDALGLQGVSLAHLGRAEQAVAVLGRAIAASPAPVQRLRALRTQAFALYALSRMADALPVQRQVLQLAAELGDETEAVTAELSLAALLLPAGDVQASYTHARGAAQRAQAMGLAQDSVLAPSNLITLGMAAASLGRLDEAVLALEQAVQLSGPGSPPSAQAKSRTALARVRLWLGDDDAVRALLDKLPAGIAPGQRMQAALLLAQAEQMAGRSGDAAWARLARLGAEHPALPPMLSATLEWSYQGPPGPAIAKLRDERIQLQGLGLDGAARVLHLRELDLLLQDAAAPLGGPASAARLLAVQQAAEMAAALMPQVAAGTLHARAYPPEAWRVLHRAFVSAGHTAQAQECRLQALHWLEAASLPPGLETRQRFMSRNPVNREWLA